MLLLRSKQSRQILACVIVAEHRASVIAGQVGSGGTMRTEKGYRVAISDLPRINTRSDGHIGRWYGGEAYESSSFCSRRISCPANGLRLPARSSDRHQSHLFICLKLGTPNVTSSQDGSGLLPLKLILPADLTLR